MSVVVTGDRCGFQSQRADSNYYFFNNGFLFVIENVACEHKIFQELCCVFYEFLPQKKTFPTL